MAARKRRKNKKRFQKFIITLIIALIAALGAFIYSKVTEEPIQSVEGLMNVHFIDVGQGDAQLIVSPTGDTMLIDAGPGKSSDALLDYLDRAKIKKLDYVIFTHYDEDHIGGGDDVLKKITNVEKILMPDYTPTTVAGKRLLEAIDKLDAEVIHPEQGYEFSLDGGVKIEVLSNDKIDDDGKNGDSIVTMIKFGATKFLLTGDATEKCEEEIINAYPSALDCDVLTACHHASKYSNTDNFLSKTKPEHIVISCGEDNKYGHPHKEALDRFYKVTKDIYCTAKTGDIVFTSDGTKVETKTEPIKKSDYAALPLEYFYIKEEPSDKKYLLAA